METAEQNVDLFGTPLARFPCRLDALVGRSPYPDGGNDEVYTPDETAAMIVDHFRPCGRVCEPCKGGGAFLRAMPGADWFEIAEGRDFLAHEGGRWDWIVTNPPWSKILVFLKKSLTHADNVVFLCLVNALWMTARLREIQAQGFGIVETMIVPHPPPPWPQMGFALGATWMKRGWTGGLHISYPPNNALHVQPGREAGGL
jgi:hypothetical protein